jgi:hypothetical protein
LGSSDGTPNSRRLSGAGVTPLNSNFLVDNIRQMLDKNDDEASDEEMPEPPEGSPGKESLDLLTIGETRLQGWAANKSNDSDDEFHDYTGGDHDLPSLGYTRSMYFDGIQDLKARKAAPGQNTGVHFFQLEDKEITKDPMYCTIANFGDERKIPGYNDEWARKTGYTVHVFNSDRKGSIQVNTKQSVTVENKSIKIPRTKVQKYYDDDYETFPQPSGEITTLVDEVNPNKIMKSMDTIKGDKPKPEEAAKIPAGAKIINYNYLGIGKKGKKLE